MDNAYNRLIDPNGLQQFHSGVILSVSYYDEDTYNNVKYYMQLSDYSTLKSLGY